MKKVLYKKTAYVLPFLFLTIFFFSGCPPKMSGPLLPSFSIAFQDWVGYGLFYLAEEKGFMRDEGIELFFVDEPLDSARRDALKEGMLDFEAGTLDLLVSKAALHTPVVAVMKIDHSFGADGIVASEKIKTLADLAGKRVALARDDVGETLLSVLFHDAGLPFNRVTVVPRSPEEVAQAFLDGDADACVTWEPSLSKALQRPGAHLLMSTRDYPGIIIDTLNVRKDLFKKDPDSVKKVMRGWFRALQYYREHPFESCEIIAKHYKITPEKYRKAVEGLQWEDYNSQKAPGVSKVWADIFHKVSVVKSANGRISQEPDSRGFLDHTLLETLYENRP